MNRNEFKKILPTAKEIEQIDLSKVKDKNSFMGGAVWLSGYLTAKFPDFTEEENDSYKKSTNEILKNVCEHLYNSGRAREYSDNELAEKVEQFLQQNQK